MDEFAGALSERVVVERWDGVADDSGGEVGSWGPSIAVWAAVAPAGTGAAVEAEAPARRPRYRVRMRGARSADLSCRLLWRGRMLSVLSASPDPARERVELLVEDRG
jgi:head-tail adaptor